MRYNEIERLQKLAGILTEIKVNKPSNDRVDSFIKTKYNPINSKYNKGFDEDYISYEFEGGYHLQYYPNSKQIVGSSPKNSRIRSDIQKYINSLK